ncbi:MAG: hypothetical protein ACM3UZ_07115 [Acidobacteriota bacterium]
MSNNEKSIVAYFPSSGQVASAGDQLRSILQITDPQSMTIEQLGNAGADNSTIGLGSNIEDSDTHVMTVTVPMMMTERAMEIIRSQGGTIR